MYFKIVK